MNEKTNTQHLKNTSWRQFRHTSVLGGLALSSALLITACTNSSVVSNSESTPASSPAAPAATVAAAAPTVEAVNPAAAAAVPSPSLVVAATPLTAPTTVMASDTLKGLPKSEVDPLQQPNSRGRIGDFPVELSTAKPAATVAPDPFGPRPTPPVVMADGKIKQQWQAPAEALALKNPFTPTAQVLVEGKVFYEQKCHDCHGRSGKGNGFMSAMTKRDGKPIFPTNLVSQVVQANTDGELFWKITNGRSPMPAHKIRFDDEQRWKIVTYLRTLK